MRGVFVFKKTLQEKKLPVSMFCIVLPLILQQGLVPIETCILPKAFTSIHNVWIKFPSNNVLLKTTATGLEKKNWQLWKGNNSNISKYTTATQVRCFVGMVVPS